LAYCLVAEYNVEHFLNDLSHSFERDCFSQISVEFYGKADDVAEASALWQVARPYKQHAAIAAFVPLNAILVLAITVEVLCPAPFAKGHKRTFFIAKSTQICLYHFLSSGTAIWLRASFVAVPKILEKKLPYLLFPLKLKLPYDCRIR
jgi:hypothetical protein